MFEHYIHEVYKNKNGKIFLLDIAWTPDCEWESAYAEFDESMFLRAWAEEDGNTEYTFDDIVESGEDFNAFPWWIIVDSHGTRRSLKRMYRELIQEVEGL